MLRPSVHEKRYLCESSWTVCERLRFEIRASKLQNFAHLTAPLYRTAQCHSSNRYLKFGLCEGVRSQPSLQKCTVLWRRLTSDVIQLTNIFLVHIVLNYCTICAIIIYVIGVVINCSIRWCQWMLKFLSYKKISWFKFTGFVLKFHERSWTLQCLWILLWWRHLLVNILVRVWFVYVCLLEKNRQRILKNNLSLR